MPDSDSGVFSGQGTGNTPESLAVADRVVELRLILTGQGSSVITFPSEARSTGALPMPNAAVRYGAAASTISVM